MNNKGFAWLPVLLIVFVGIAVGVGLYKYEQWQTPVPQASIYQPTTTAPATSQNQPPTNNSQDASDIVETSPAAGEVLQAGSQYVIKWKGWQESPTRTVDITSPYISIGLNPASTPHLNPEAYPNTVITTGPGGSEEVLSTGTYAWTIPSSTTPGQYVLAFCEFVEADCRGSLSYSGVFTIVAPSSTQQSTSNQTGWQTYTNTQYGFSFQYPDNFVIREENSDTDIVDLQRKDSNPYAEANDNIGVSTDINAACGTTNISNASNGVFDTGWDGIMDGFGRSVCYKYRGIAVGVGVVSSEFSEAVGNEVINSFKFSNAPTISSISPESVYVGAMITVNGVNFGQNDRVLLGSNSGHGDITYITPISISSSSLSFTIPSNMTTDDYSVQVDNPSLPLSNTGYLMVQ